MTQKLRKKMEKELAKRLAAYNSKTGQLNRQKEATLIEQKRQEQRLLAKQKAKEQQEQQLIEANRMIEARKAAIARGEMPLEVRRRRPRVSPAESLLLLVLGDAKAVDDYLEDISGIKEAEEKAILPHLPPPMEAPDILQSDLAMRTAYAVHTTPKTVQARPDGIAEDGTLTDYKFSPSAEAAAEQLKDEAARETQPQFGEFGFVHPGSHGQGTE